MRQVCADLAIREESCGGWDIQMGQWSALTTRHGALAVRMIEAAVEVETKRKDTSDGVTAGNAG